MTESQPPAGGTRRIGRPGLPRSFQARLSLAFVTVVAITLAIVSGLILYRLDDSLYHQELDNLNVRATAVANVVRLLAVQATGNQYVVSASNRLNPAIASMFSGEPTGSDRSLLGNIADQVAQANVSLRFGSISAGDVDETFVPVAQAPFAASLAVAPQPRQARDSISTTVQLVDTADVPNFPWALQVTLSQPYTTRASTLESTAGFLALIALGAFIASVLAAAFIARRFSTPLRRLTDAARALAEGDLDRRVPIQSERSATREIDALSRQFNAMADRLQESMSIIRTDRDRSREFLADVSHELRTPIAALRTFNELLQEGAADDPSTRDEFLESSSQQIERLDWLSQNLLELSKLDSGLLQLDLRPEDLRATVESAVEQASAAARRRGVELSLDLPDRPLRRRHDPQRIGQVVSNIVGNALKFTPRGGQVAVRLAADATGVRITVTDTGVGIDTSELPRIFERFYRGSRANEARSSGSGLGLSIARSIVEMHGGRIEVESRLGAGSTFTVILPAESLA